MASIAPRTHNLQIPSERMELLFAVLDALNRGWSVLPMRGKYPAAEYLPNNKWAPLRTTPYTMEQALSIFRDGEGLGFATITGTPSRVVVIDVDPRNGGTLDGRDVPITPTERTISGGTHLYFKLPEGVILPSKELWPGVELLAEGKYTVTAPSAGYEWHKGRSPDDVPLADLPAWVWEHVSPSKDPKTPHPETPTTSPFQDVETSSKYPLLVSSPKEPLEQSPKETRASVVPITRLQGDTLRQWDTDDAFTRAACELMGIPSLPIGTLFKCILPGHEEEKPSASLWRDDTGAVVYRDWHHRDGEEWYTLAEVRASLAYGEARKLSGPELATWKLRLLVETGFISPAEVKAEPLPDDAPDAAQRVYEGFLLLLRCKWLHTPNTPTPLAWRFAAAWCGDISKDTAQRGMTWLMKRGYVHRVGEVSPKGGGRKMGVFMPGTEVHVKSREGGDKRTFTATKRGKRDA